MDEKISEFRLLTNASLESAMHYLEACDNNLEAAVELYLQSSCEDAAQNPSTSRTDGATRSEQIDDDVRAPMAGTSGQLVEESFHSSYAPRTRRRAANSVFDRFRDFEAETKSREASIYGTSNTRDSKLKTLEALFRPPIDIMHQGDFESAKLVAAANGHWLMVNIQNVQEFACQVLNRDIWSNSAVKELITNNFVLWQIYNDSADGARFEAYYRCSIYPYVAILDPRTGEMLTSINTTDAVAFCDIVTAFLDSHPSFGKAITDSDTGISNSQPHAPPVSFFQESNRFSNGASSSVSSSVKRKHDYNDEEIESANGATDVANISEGTHRRKSKLTKFMHIDDNDISSSVADEDNGTQDRRYENGEWRRFIVDVGAADVQLMFRLPDGSKRRLDVSKRTTVKAILSFVEWELGMSTVVYDVVLNFPTRLLNETQPELTLEQLNFARRELIYVERR